MNLRVVLKIAGITLLSIVIFSFLAIETARLRGYWAVGGEIFIPIFILGYGVYTILGTENEK